LAAGVSAICSGSASPGCRTGWPSAASSASGSAPALDGSLQTVLLQGGPEQVVGVQIGHRPALVRQLGGPPGGVGEDLATLVAHVLRNIDPLRTARLGRPEEAREQIVPVTGSGRSPRSDTHLLSSLSCVSERAAHVRKPRHTVRYSAGRGGLIPVVGP